MREILFKAKRTDTDTWIEGNYLNDEEIAYISGFIYNDTIFGFEKIPFKCQVIPKTVSQFTGLYDKNGVRIWENDIVEYDDLFLNVQGRFEKGKTKSIVTFDNEHACFSPFEPDLYELHIQAENVEVIGNRFDNPELLKGK